MLSFRDTLKIKKLSEKIDLNEDREKNLRMVKRIIDSKGGLDALDNIKDETLEDLLLALTARGGGTGDRLEDLLNILFGDLEAVPRLMTSKGTPRIKAGKEVLDVDSDYYKNTLYARMGSESNGQWMKKALRAALKGSSGDVSQKIKYVHSLSDDKSLIDIKNFLKVGTINNVVDLLGKNFPSGLAKDIFKSMAPNSPSKRIGPSEMWLALHVRDGSLDAGSAGATGDIATRDGKYSVEVKGGDGLVSPGPDSNRGSHKVAFPLLEGELGMDDPGKKERVNFLNTDRNLYKTAISKLPPKKAEEVLFRFFRAYYSTVYTDQDIKDLIKKVYRAKKFTPVSKLKEEFFKFHVLGYWKYKGKQGGGKSFDSILFLNKTTGKGAIIEVTSSGQVKIPNGVAIRNPEWVGGTQNYADGFQGINVK